MQRVIDTFPYSTGVVNIKIDVSTRRYIAVLGAAALNFDQQDSQNGQTVELGLFRKTSSA